MGSSQSQPLNVLMLQSEPQSKSRLSYHPVRRIKQLRNGQRGPGALLGTVLESSRNCEVRIIHELTDVQGDALVWIPSGNLKMLNQAQINRLKGCKVSLGPNIDWFNSDNLRVIQKIPNAKCVAPSQWVVPTIQEKVGKDTEIFVWASGVNLNFWKPKYCEREMVLIYLKSQISHKTISELQNYIGKIGHKSIIVKYGDYSRSAFKKILSRSFSAIWIGGTESQGIALLESWAMNVPTLVLPKDSWESPEGKKYPASAAPYLDESLGRFFTSELLSFTEVGSFITDCIHNKFEPRKTVALKYCATDQTLALVNSIER